MESILGTPAAIFSALLTNVVSQQTKPKTLRKPLCSTYASISFKQTLLRSRKHEDLVTKTIFVEIIFRLLLFLRYLWRATSTHEMCFATFIVHPCSLLSNNDKRFYHAVTASDFTSRGIRETRFEQSKAPTCAPMSLSRTHTVVKLRSEWRFQGGITDEILTSLYAICFSYASRTTFFFLTAHPIRCHNGVGYLVRFLGIKHSEY